MNWRKGLENNLSQENSAPRSCGDKVISYGEERVLNSPLTKILEEYRAKHKQFENNLEEA